MSNHIRDGGRGARPAANSKGLWLRLYTSVLKPADKTQDISDRLFRRWVYALCTYKDNGGVMPGTKALARCFGCNEQQAQASLNELVEAGLFDRNSDGTVTPHDWDEMQFESDSAASRMRNYRARKRATVNVTGDVTRYVTSSVTVAASETETETETEYKSPISPFAENVTADAEFDRIWNAYPPKGRARRIQCEQIFSTLIGKANGNAAQLVEEILAPLAEGGKWANSKQWGKNEGQFIFGLADYLTQQRWREDPEQKGEWD